jgi:hypothetical protein
VRVHAGRWQQRPTPGRFSVFVRPPPSTRARRRPGLPGGAGATRAAAAGQDEEAEQQLARRVTAHSPARRTPLEKS